MTNKWPCPLIENNINESGCGEDDEDCGSSSGNEQTTDNENKIPGKALFQWSSFEGYKSVSSHFSYSWNFPDTDAAGTEKSYPTPDCGDTDALWLTNGDKSSN